MAASGFSGPGTLSATSNWPPALAGDGKPENFAAATATTPLNSGTSVSDPDPRVFGPPGSRSGSFYHHAEIVRKILDSYYFVTLFDFLSLKNYVNVPSKSIFF
jgi:hypothetical protein